MSQEGRKEGRERSKFVVFFFSINTGEQGDGYRVGVSQIFIPRLGAVEEEEIKKIIYVLFIGNIYRMV